MAHDVFISYSSKDAEAARTVCSGLEGSGISCWIAPRDVLSGVPYGAALVQAVSGSRLFVLVLSKNSNWSHHVSREVELAAKNGVPILPFRIDEVAPTDAMEYFLSHCHWLDATQPPLEDHLPRLIGDAQALLGQQQAVPPPSAGPAPAERTEPGADVAGSTAAGTAAPGPRGAPPAAGHSAPPFPLVVEESGSFVESLPLSDRLVLKRIAYGAGAMVPKDPPTPHLTNLLPRRFDDAEGKWKLDTKGLIDAVTPLAVPHEVELTVEGGTPGTTLHAVAAVDEFYMLPPAQPGGQEEVRFSGCRLGRPGVLEFIRRSRGNRLALVGRGAHPYVLGDGQGALNLIVLVEERQGRMCRSGFYPLVREGILTPQDLWHFGGRCLVSPDGNRIAFQSISPRAIG